MERKTPKAGKPKAAAKKSVKVREKPAKLFETGCCKRFDPKPWNEKTLSWKGKLFVKYHVLTLFNIPLNMGGVMKASQEKLSAADAYPKTPLMLYDITSLFGAEVYVEVTKEIAGEKMERISGTMLSKVFEGPFSKIGAWMSEMRKWAQSKGKTPQKFYTFFTMCPACAKAYGQNYTVLLAKV